MLLMSSLKSALVINTVFLSWQGNMMLWLIVQVSERMIYVMIKQSTQYVDKF